MAVNFSSLLDRPVESAEKPKPKPPGTYTATVKGFNFGESQKKKTPFVRFQLANVQPGADVDQTLLAQAGDLTKWSPAEEYYLTDDSLYRLREMLESCNVKVEGRSFKDTIPEVVGMPVQFECYLEQMTNEQTGEVSIFSRIRNVRGV